MESASYPTTSITGPEPENAEDPNTKGGADFSLLPTEFPNGPRSTHPPMESASYPTTSITNPEPENAEDPNTKGGADFSLLPTEFPNEPRSTHPPMESASYPTTSITGPEPENAEDLNAKGGADFSLLPTEPQVPLQQSPAVPFRQSPASPPPANRKIIEFPNEPRFAHPPIESTASPATSNPACSPFEHAAATGRHTRVA